LLKLKLKKMLISAVTGSSILKFLFRVVPLLPSPRRLRLS
jgi:hypothetical protein